jgi:two-component system NtrC family sensor kinase
MYEHKRSTILFRFLAFILPLIVISIVVTGLILSSTTYEYFQQSVNQDYRNIITSVSGEIRLYMKNAERGLEGLSWVISSAKMDPWQEEISLTAFHHVTPEFLSISLVSPHGAEIINVGQETADRVDAVDEAFREALQGRIAVSGVTVTEENIPHLYIAVPVTRLGKVEKVLLGELNLKSVWDVLEGIKIGRTGQVYLMDLSGRLIGHKEMDRVVRAVQAAESHVLERLEESEDRPLQWTEVTEEGDVFCLGYTIPDLRWIIVLSQSEHEIYSYVRENVQWAVIATLIITMLAGLLGWSQVKRFLKPIHALHRQVQKIGQGDLDQKISVDSRDEIGDLSLAFNEMTDSLKGFIESKGEVKNAEELVHAQNLAILGTTSTKVTHEVGNLLTNVGMGLLTLKNETLTPRGAKVIEILERDAVRVRQFIRSFLQFAKIPQLNLERVSLDDLLDELLVVHQRETETRSVQMKLVWRRELPRVRADRHLMYQVFNNLIKNSLEALDGPGSIMIEGSNADGFLLVSITDTGPGMTPQVLEKIFEPFYTSKGKRGTGLGLSICKTIVEAHRGTIECSSEPGRGATFVIKLPLL